MDVQNRVAEFLRTLATRRNKPLKDISAAMPLYAEGLGLDSLDAAELSAMLEGEFGRDPYTAGEIPQTVGDILRYYES